MTAEMGCPTDWSRVAEKLPLRTNKDCRKRWINHVCGGLKKGPWEADEDVSLCAAVAQHGQKWTLVASQVGSRSADQCAKRWQHNLDPRLDHQRWTPKEDELLLESVGRYGREWRKIQEKHYSTRSANDLKNRFTILSKKSRSRGNSICGPATGPGHHSSSDPIIVGDPNQDSTSPGTDSGTTSFFDSTMLPEENWENVYNNKNLHIDVGEIMQSTTNVQQQEQEQQMRSQKQHAATFFPLSHDSQSMAVDGLEHPPTTSAFSWTTGTTSSSGTGSHPLPNSDFQDFIFSNNLATMSYHPYHIQTGTGDTSEVGKNNNNVEMEGLILGFDPIDPDSDGMKNGHLLSLLAHRANRLGNCSPGGSVSLQAEGCDREVLNYLLDVLLPIRHLIKMEINM
ncbi:hypothetical protein PVAR5_8764 [Paecilomyces variotii No. 5]|uniref:Uncharacterized protein n=1 Tax=Byssochlamys spectabilis (strain No. 5 / NBRC 109023) TaxID=1356009 RepID=V5GD76_BYSSN|nr:hypothetical protein PVAR5_8764 [Paecilomyces variotii No. 5]